ncbi:MAG: type II toxin-antitoxin system PemK/MazF family toxin [Gammaproteobacteria bacterium]
MSKQYIPDRNDIVWLDFDPTKGKEIRKYRPAFVLSSKVYNRSTGLLICCPISTSIRGNLTEVPIDYLDKPSVIAAGIIQTLSWKDRKIKHITRAGQHIINEVLCRLIPLIGGEDYCEE